MPFICSSRVSGVSSKSRERVGRWGPETPPPCRSERHRARARALILTLTARESVCKSHAIKAARRRSRTSDPLSTVIPCNTSSTTLSIKVISLLLVPGSYERFLGAPYGAPTSLLLPPTSLLLPVLTWFSVDSPIAPGLTTNNDPVSLSLFIPSSLHLLFSRLSSLRYRQCGI